MSESIHTTEQIREFVAYGDWGTEEYPVEWFDAWLAVHDAEVERAASEKAWQEGHDSSCIDWDHICEESHPNLYRAALGLTAGQGGENGE